MVHEFEFIGMIFSMLGAFFMSRDTIKYKKTLYFSGLSFLVSNLVMIYVATSTMLIPLIIQMALFFKSSMLIVISHSENKKIVKRILYPLEVLVLGILLTYVSKTDFQINTTLIEVIAATMAITGSFLLKTKNLDIRIVSFVLFLLADILYAYIGYQNSLYFFMIQAIFFWYTSIAGILNTLKTKKVYAAVAA
jgi:uncharacterized membrane protein YhhN